MSKLISVEILGTLYDIYIEPEDSDSKYQSMDGWSDWTAKEIHVVSPKKDENSVKYLHKYVNKVIRHEVIHAYLHESGLDNNSFYCDAWARNEEMVDWFAIMMPKITCTYTYVLAKLISSTDVRYMYDKANALLAILCFSSDIDEIDACNSDIHKWVGEIVKRRTEEILKEHSKT